MFDGRMFDIEVAPDGFLYISGFDIVYRRSVEGALDCLLGEKSFTPQFISLHSPDDFDPFVQYGIKKNSMTVFDIAAAADGSLYLAVWSGLHSFVILKIDPQGTIARIAGNATAYGLTEYPVGSKGFPAIPPDGTDVQNSSLPVISGQYESNTLTRQVQLSVDKENNLFFFVNYGLVYGITSEGTIFTVADLREAILPTTYPLYYNRILGLIVGEDGFLYVLTEDAIKKISRDGSQQESFSNPKIARTSSNQSYLSLSILSDGFTGLFCPPTYTTKPSLLLLDSLCQSADAINLNNYSDRGWNGICTAYDTNEDIFYIASTHGGSCDGETTLWRIKDIGKQLQTPVFPWIFY